MQIGVVNEHHKEKNCSSNEFFISSNLTLLLVCGLEANNILIALEKITLVCEKISLAKYHVVKSF